MLQDPFKEAREKDGILKCPFQGENIPMLLRHADVRAAAKDWQTFSSDAPFRVPIPSEEAFRSVRQVPLETDPPEHSAYRKIVEPFFKRAKSPEVVTKVQNLINRLIDDALVKDRFDSVHDFALPIQSYAFTYLINVPEAQGETYLKWGLHVFDGANDGGSVLEDHLATAFDQASENPGDDFFSTLNQATYQNRPLTHVEKMGFANLTFAAGRDTIIHTISSIIHYFGVHPEKLKDLRESPRSIVLASEEFFRAFMPLTHIGRVCPVATEFNNLTLPADSRVSLGWASANFDEEVFEAPHQVQLDRKPNPHVSFGFGTHLCLGAPHARLIVRTLLESLASKVSTIQIHDQHPRIENNPSYQRPNGFDLLSSSFKPIGF